MPKISEKIVFHLPTGASMLRRGGYGPLALPWRHPWQRVGRNRVEGRDGLAKFSALAQCDKTGLLIQENRGWLAELLKKASNFK